DAAIRPGPESGDLRAAVWGGEVAPKALARRRAVQVPRRRGRQCRRPGRGVARMDQLEQISNEIRDYMEAVNDARDQAYQRSRALTSECSLAIRAIHREEWELAHRL